MKTLIIGAETILALSTVALYEYANDQLAQAGFDFNHAIEVEFDYALGQIVYRQSE